jgi:hypothetical protein
MALPSYRGYPAARGIQRYSPGIGAGMQSIAEALQRIKALKFDYLVTKARMEQLQREKAEQREYAEQAADKEYFRKLQTIGASMSVTGDTPEELIEGIAKASGEAEQEIPEVKFPTGQWTPQSMEEFSKSWETGDPDYSALVRKPDEPRQSIQPAPKWTQYRTLYVDPTTRQPSDRPYEYKLGPDGKVMWETGQPVGRTPQPKEITAQEKQRYIEDVIPNSYAFKKLKKLLKTQMPETFKQRKGDQDKIHYLIETDFPEGEEYRTLDSVENLNKTYPAIISIIRKLKGQTQQPAKPKFFE